jgi:hypothetical protein
MTATSSAFASASASSSSSHSSSSASSSETADRQAITDLIYRYCRSMDRRDAPLGYTVFHDDAVTDYGEGFFSGSGHGFIDWVTELHASFTTHSHQITNIILELDGDRAASESYAIVALRRMDGDQLVQITGWCRYLDRWSRRAGRWAIDKRKLIMDLDEVRPVVPLTAAPYGARDKSDPSYDLFAGRW